MPGQPGTERLCEWCHDPIPGHARRDARFCKRTHKSAHRRARKQREAEGVTNPRAGLPIDAYTDSEGRSWAFEGGYPSEEGGYASESEAGSPDAASAAQRIAISRFQRLLRQRETAEAGRPVILPSEAERQHRNQGVVLSEIRERQLDALELRRDREAIRRAESTAWTPQDRFHGDPNRQREAFAARARADRARNRQAEQIRQAPMEYPDARQWQPAVTPRQGPAAPLWRRLPARYLNT